MQRFILQQNIERFRALLNEAREEGERRRLEAMAATAQRELALLNAGLIGARDRKLAEVEREALAAAREILLGWFDKTYADSPKLAAVIDPEPGLTIMNVNETYLRSSGRARGEVVGQPLFLAFPDNPDNPMADGVSHLYASLRKVAESGRPDAMGEQRYDVADGHGHYAERWWRPVNSALNDDHGRLVFLLHVVDDVTDEVLGRRPGA